ncbi:MAG: MATE family efflux transporter, partial [Dysosmobacter sp.]|nr:MATE family efflux transporter [Dysosmobacter sp.]
RGIRDSPRVKAGFRAGVKLVWLLSLPLFLLYFFAGRRALSLFLENPTKDALQTGVYYLRILSPFYFIISAKLVADGVLRGSGRMLCFMASTFTDLILRVTLAALLARTALGALGIWCSWPIGWTAATAMSILFYRAGPWKNAGDAAE